MRKLAVRMSTPKQVMALQQVWHLNLHAASSRLFLRNRRLSYTASKKLHIGCWHAALHTLTFAPRGHVAEGSAMRLPALPKPRPYTYLNRSTSTCS